MNEDKQIGLLDFYTNMAHLALNLLHSASRPLDVIARKPGTIGGGMLFPSLFIGEFLMLFCPSIYAWYAVKYITPLAVIHFVIYCKRHRDGRGVHPYYVGEPYIKNVYLNNAVFGGVLFLVFIGDHFAWYWLLQIPISYANIELLHLRDRARARQVRGQMIEQSYWQDIIGDENDSDVEEYRA